MGFLGSIVKSVILLHLVAIVGLFAYVLLFKFQEPSPQAFDSKKTISDISKFRYSRVKTNGVTLNVIEAGPADGELVVLLHGFPETALLSWHNQIGPLAEAGYHVIAPDQRGYNTSDKPEGVAPYQASETTADVLGLLSHYKADSAFIVGHDWGAMVAWRFAINHPEKVKKLSILNVPHPGVFMKYLMSHPTQMLKSWYIYFFQLPYLPEFLFARENYRVGRALMAGSSNKGKTFSSDLIPLYVQGWSEKDEVTGMLNWYRAAITIDSFSKKLDNARVKPDTLILWGEKDVALESGMVEPSLGLCDNGKAIYFSEATHWVQHDQPTEVTSHLIEFFNH